MAISEARRKANVKWDAANMTVVGCRVTKKRAEHFKAVCKEANTTPNAVLKSAMDAFIAEHELATLQLVAGTEETGGE